LVWACTRNEGNRIPPELLNINLETTRLTDQEIDGKMREDGRLVGG